MSDQAENRFETFSSRLAIGGGRAALEYLSSLSCFRYLSVIYYSDGLGHPVYHYDQLNPDVIEADEIDQRASYCSIVLEERRQFETSDSLLDSRLTHHPSREGVRSYFGLPLMAEDGEAHAVLCHYDQFPKSTKDLDQKLFGQAALLFQQHLARYGQERKPSTVETVHTEVLGNSTLYVIRRTKAEWSAPRFSIERGRQHADGSIAARVAYGAGGFSSLEDALEFGREWCQAT